MIMHHQCVHKSKESWMLFIRVHEHMLLIQGSWMLIIFVQSQMHLTWLKFFKPQIECLGLESLTSAVNLLALRSKSERNTDSESSIWSRAEFSTQGLYTKVCRCSSPNFLIHTWLWLMSIRLAFLTWWTSVEKCCKLDKVCWVPLRNLDSLALLPLSYANKIWQKERKNKGSHILKKSSNPCSGL